MHAEFWIGKTTVYLNDGNQNPKMISVIKIFETYKRA
jgi:hypothetical protein